MIPTIAKWTYERQAPNIARLHVRVDLRQFDDLPRLLKKTPGVESVRVLGYHVVVTKAELFEWDEITEGVEPLMRLKLGNLGLDIQIQAKEATI